MAETRVPTALPLIVQDLTVTSGALTAVARLSFNVRPGEIYGLLGSNGAGKSSTIKSVVGLQKPASGQVRVLGLDPIADELTAKARVGYVPETALLYDALTPREFLEFVASIRRLPRALLEKRVPQFVQAFQIADEFDRPIATLSNGTRQKVLLISALLHEPPLLVLDEPFNNLDPRSVRIMKELLVAYVADGRAAVLFSTHTMEVAEKLCHRIGILDKGHLVGEGTLEELRGLAQTSTANLEELYLKLTAEEEQVAKAVRALGTHA
jgi:ABC-2 type transport system ATP-binding protein